MTGATWQTQRRESTVWAVALMLVALVPVLFLALPLGAMLWRTSDELIHLSNRTASTLAEAMRLSLLTSGASLLAILLLGTPLAYALARKRF